MNVIAKRNLTAKNIKPLIVIMFDDAGVTDYTKAYQDMWVSRRIKGTSSITTGKVGSNADFMTWEQIHEMNSNGWGFGCHGQTHTYFTELTEAQLRAELESVNESFVANGLPYATNCTPPGAQKNPLVNQIVNEYYDAVLGDGNTTIKGINKRRTSNFTSPPGFFWLAHWDGVADANTTDGLNYFKSAIDLAIENREVCVFIFHGVADVVTDAPYQVLRSNFTQILDYGISKGVEFVTFKEMYDYIKTYQTLI